MTPDQVGYDHRAEHLALAQDPTVVDLDWTASGYRRTQTFAARVADELDVRALTQSFAIGMLAAAAAPDDLDASDEQVGRLARGVVQALVDLRLVAP